MQEAADQARSDLHQTLSDLRENEEAVEARKAAEESALAAQRRAEGHAAAMESAKRNAERRARGRSRLVTEGMAALAIGDLRWSCPLMQASRRRLRSCVGSWTSHVCTLTSTARDAGNANALLIFGARRGANTPALPPAILLPRPLLPNPALCVLSQWDCVALERRPLPGQINQSAATFRLIAEAAESQKHWERERSKHIDTAKKLRAEKKEEAKQAQVAADLHVDLPAVRVAEAPGIAMPVASRVSDPQ